LFCFVNYSRYRDNANTPRNSKFRNACEWCAVMTRRWPAGSWRNKLPLRKFLVGIICFQVLGKMRRSITAQNNKTKKRKYRATV